MTVQVMKSECDIFTTKPLQLSVKGHKYVQYLPRGTLQHGNSIEFFVPNTSEYLDLNDTYIEIEGYIKKSSGRNLENIVLNAAGVRTAGSRVAPIANVLDSLFESLQVLANSKQISQGSHYGYRSYIENVLSYSKNSQETILNTGLFCQDTPGQLNRVDPFDVDSVDSGLRERADYFKNGKKVILMGKIHSDIFNLDKFLLNEVNLTLKFNRANDKFILMNAEDYDCQFEITNAILHVKRIELSPSIALAHAKTLRTHTAKYNLVSSEITTVIVPSNGTVFNRDNLFLGSLPKRITFGLVKDASFSGSYTGNPYDFSTFSLATIAVTINGSHVSGSPLEFSNDPDYLKGYLTLFSGSSKFGETDLAIRRKDFNNGFALFQFPLSEDSECNDHTSVTQTGNLKLQLSFKNAPRENLVLVLYAEYDSCLEINFNREIFITK